MLSIRKNHRHLEELSSFLLLFRVLSVNLLEFLSLWPKCKIFEVLTLNLHFIVSVSKEHKQVIADNHRRVIEAFNSKTW